MQRTEEVSFETLGGLLEALFHGAPRVYEAYSAFDSSIKQFEDRAHVEMYFQKVREAGRSSMALAAHFPEARGQVQISKISLNPDDCAGATWRESLEGWGLIRIYVTYLSPSAVEVRIAANTEKRAAAWAPTYPNLGPPSLWDWKQVEKHTRRLIRRLRGAA